MLKQKEFAMLAYEDMAFRPGILRLKRYCERYVVVVLFEFSF